MTRIIRVTNGDIERGESMGICPITLALRRRFPKADIRVWYDLIEIDEKWYQPNERIADFLYDFYHKLPMKPFGFDLDKLIRETPILM